MLKNTLLSLSFIPALAISLLPANAPVNHSDETSSTTGEVLVNAEWLSSKLDEPQLVIIDTRNREEYLKGHIPGAISIPVDSTFNPGFTDGRVGNLQHIRSLFSEAGLRHDRDLVIYDDSRYIDAGRMFWVLELYGHENVSLLNGGIAAWQKDPSRVLVQEERQLPRTDYVPRVSADKLVSRSHVNLAISDTSKLILDTRDNNEYLGHESIAKRAGHIPGAVNIPWSEAFTETDGIRMLKSQHELKQLYNPVVNGKRIYTYCNKGKQSSLTYTLLRHLGHDVAHYDGSWYEWGNDVTLPMSPTIVKYHGGVR